MAPRPLAMSKDELSLLLELGTALRGNPELRAQLQQKVAEQKDIINVPSTSELLTECCGQPVTPWVLHQGGRGGPQRVAPSAMAGLQQSQARISGSSETVAAPATQQWPSAAHLAPATVPQQFPNLHPPAIAPAVTQQLFAPSAQHLVPAPQQFPPARAPQQLPLPPPRRMAAHAMQQFHIHPAHPVPPPTQQQQFAPASQQSALPAQHFAPAPRLAEPFTTPQQPSRHIAPPRQPHSSPVTVQEDEDEDDEMTEYEDEGEEECLEGEVAANEYFDEVEYDSEGNTISEQVDDEDQDQDEVQDAVKQWNANVVHHIDVPGPKVTVSADTAECLVPTSRFLMDSRFSHPTGEDRVILPNRKAAQETFDGLKKASMQQVVTPTDVAYTPHSALLDVPPSFQRVNQQQPASYNPQLSSTFDHNPDTRFARQQPIHSFPQQQGTAFERVPSYRFQREYPALMTPQPVSAYDAHYTSIGQQDDSFAIAPSTPAPPVLSTFQMPDVGEDLDFNFGANAGNGVFASNAATTSGLPALATDNHPGFFVTADAYGNSFSSTDNMPPSYLGSAAYSLPSSSSNVGTGHTPSASDLPVSATFEDPGSFGGSFDGFTPTSSMGFTVSPLDSPTFAAFKAAMRKPLTTGPPGPHLPPVDMNGAYGSFYRPRGEY